MLSVSKVHGQFYRRSCNVGVSEGMGTMMAKSDDASSMQGGISVIIDGATCFAPARQMTGAQLRKLPEPPVAADRDLWQEVEGGLDQIIQPGDKVDLHAQMRFFTVPRVINPGSRGLCYAQRTGRRSGALVSSTR